MARPPGGLTVQAEQHCSTTARVRGSTVYGDRVALRPAISNWRTTSADLDLSVEVVRELGARTVSAN